MAAQKQKFIALPPSFKHEARRKKIASPILQMDFLLKAKSCIRFIQVLFFL